MTEPEFDQLFSLANYTNLTQEERRMYNTSVKVMWDNKNAMDFAKEQGLEKGLEQGLEKGLEQAHKESAPVLKSKGVSVEIIAEATKLSIEEIEAL